jgi:hypothetical protein
LEEYRQAFAIREDLSRKSADLEIRAECAESSLQLCRALVGAHQIVEGLRFCAQGKKMSEEILAADRANSSFHELLAVSHYSAAKAELAMLPSRPHLASALGSLETSIEMFRTLETDGRLSQEGQEWLERAEAALQSAKARVN